MTKIFSRIVSLILIPTFLVSGISFAAPQEKAPALTPKEAVTNPENVVIPREFGLVKSKYTGTADKLVVHIQDAHCNYEAQSNIVRMLETLVKNDGLKFISVEGADGIIDTSWFKAFPDDAVRKEVADYFMKKGEITGPEFLSITTDYPIKLFGAETREYYIQNLNAFTSSYPLKSETEKYFNTIKAALGKLKEHIYSEELRTIDARDAEYEAKKLQFNEYVRFLQAEAEKNKVNLREFDNFFKLVNVLIYEKKIDFNVTDKERSDLIDTLTKRLSKEGVTQLVAQSVSFKLGKISSADYYHYLKNLAIANAIDLAKDYPNLYNYIIYNSVYSKIENEKLFNDMAAVEIAIKEKLFRNDDQRTLEKLSRHIDTLVGLINIKLLNGDFDYYKNHKEEFEIKVFADFIQKRAAQFGLAIAIEPPADAVTRSIAKLEDFYSIAIRRDKALVDNTLAAMEKETQRIAVLVTGGFHSEGIAKLLEKQGISYMVVCPSITKDVPTPYIQVLTNQRTSFEDIVMGAAEPAQQSMLAPALIAWANGLTEAEVRAIDPALKARHDAVDAAFTVKEVSGWMDRAYRFTANHRLAQDEKVMLDAFLMAYDYRQEALVKAGVKTRRQAEQDRAELERSGVFQAAFHNAFVRVQSEIERKGAVAQEEPNQDSGTENTAEGESDPGDQIVKGKAVGASLTNAVVDRSLAAEGTEYALIFGKDPKRPELQTADPKYTTLVDDLRAVIKTGIDKGDIEDIIRAIRSTGRDVALLEKAFTKESLLKALEPGSNLMIKLVQPKAQFPGLRIPGIAMLRVGSNFGHYSARGNSVYCAWGMVDELLADNTNLARRMIVANLLHELTEMVILQNMYPGKDIADSNEDARIAHDVSERLERIVVGSGSRLGLSALDDRLEKMADRYYREYALRRLGEAARIFSLKDPERWYLWSMWRQYIDRHIHSRGTIQRRIIEDRRVLDDPNYDPLQHGNFLLACMMNPNELKEILGAHPYHELKQDGKNAEAARGVSITANSLDGGIGENVGRLKFLKGLDNAVLKALGKDVLNVKMGAKGTDLGYFITYEGRANVFVSVAEAKLLQLYVKIKEDPRKYLGVTLEPLVNDESMFSYEHLLDKTICIFDRFAAAAPDGKKRTYRELLASVGVSVKTPMFLQSDLPWIEKESGDIMLERSSDPNTKKHQPGGHGQLLYSFLYDAWKAPAPAEGKTHVRVFYNGDNLNSGVDESIVGAMKRNNWPIVKLTTVAAPIDKKGGKDGVRIKIVDGKRVYIPDQMEEADAKRVGKEKAFHQAGLDGGLGTPGTQPFNTNIIYINTTLLGSILNDLIAEKVVTEEEMYDLIAPVLIEKSAEMKDPVTGKTVSYAPIDGAAGVAVHRLNEFFMTSSNPRVKAIMKKYEVERMLNFVDVPRTPFFTPVKKCFDMWLQAYSDYYAPLDTTGWMLTDSRSDTQPPENDLQDYPLKDNDKKRNYWNELRNVIDAFGGASTVGLKYLGIHGRVVIRGAVLKGDVEIINKRSQEELRQELAKKEAGDTGKVKALDLSALIAANKDLAALYQGGIFVLENVTIVINEDLSVDVTAFKGETQKVGAIRLTGGELTGAEHGTRGAAAGEISAEASVNGAINHLFQKNRGRPAADTGIYAFRFAVGTYKQDDIDVPLVSKDAISNLSKIQGDNLGKLMTELSGMNDNFSLIVFKGLRDELRDRKVAGDLVCHPGIQRRALYLDEKDLQHLLSLQDGYQLVIDIIKHELYHINNPTATEAEAQDAFPVDHIIAALNENNEMDRDISGVTMREVMSSLDKEFTVSIAALIQEYGSNIEWAINRMKSSTAGTRGIIDIDDVLSGPQLNAAVVALMAQGYANYVLSNFKDKKQAFVGFDPRYFSKEYAQIFTRVFMANGIKVYRDINEGPTATPVTSYMSYLLNCALGIEITSSHNPPNQNGIKSSTSYGGVDTDDVSAKIANEITKLYEAGKAGKGSLKFAAYDKSKIEWIDAKELYFQNYVKRLFDAETVDNLKLAMDAGVKFIFDSLHGVGALTIEHYLDRLFDGYEWRGKIILMNDKPNPAMGNLETPDPSRPDTLEKSGVLEKLANTSGVLVSVTADMDADRIGTAVIIPDKDVARAKKFGLFVSQMKFGDKVVNVLRFTPNQIFTLLAYAQALEAINKGIPGDKLRLMTSIPSSLIAKAMIEMMGGSAVLTTVGFKNLGDQANKLDQKDKSATIVALMEESGGANIGPINSRDDRGSSIHRDKDTVVLALKLMKAAAGQYLTTESADGKKNLQGEKNLLDLYVDMAEKLGGLFYYERLDAYLPNKATAESLKDADKETAAKAKEEIIRRYRAIDHVVDQGKSASNLANPANVAALCGLFGKKQADIVKTFERKVPNTVLLIGEGDKWEYVEPTALCFTFKDGETIEVFHTGRADQEGPSISLYDAAGKFKYRTLIRASGTESLIRVYMEIFEPQDSPRPEHVYANFVKLLKYLGLDRYSLKIGGTDYVSEYVKSVNAKYNVPPAASVVDEKLHTPLAAKTPEMAARFMKGGYKQDGWGVEQGASVDGSFAIDNEGNQGYYVTGGREVFLSTVKSMRDFFQRREQILGKPIKYVIKPGIGGQHTPFQGIAEVFQVIDAQTGVVVGEYELGKDYESALAEVLKKNGADWDQVAVIPSSKSGSTDETMIVFSDILKVLLKHAAEKQGIAGDVFANAVFNFLHEVNFVNGKERPGKDLFKGFGINELTTYLHKNTSYTTVSPVQVRAVFGGVLGNMFFETTDRPEASRLSAFIRNSGLDKELGDNAPGFGAMFDNVGGRWTADLHMMAFLAYHGLDAAAYWQSRYDGIKDVRAGKHVANLIADKILAEGITDIALVVPDELFWFGKSIEQNFNESIWQKGFANLITVKESLWKHQAANYANNPKRLVINLTGMDMPKDAFNAADHIFKVADLSKLSKQEAAILMGKLTTTFYGITHVVGNDLIARALADKGYSPADVDMSDLDNPATQIVQENLYLRQPYVELGKGLLEARLSELQKAEAAKPGAIDAEMKSIQQAARKGRAVTNIRDLALPATIKSPEELAVAMGRAMAYAKSTGRKFVPFIYLEGEKFYALRDQLVRLGIEWVMQGTGDQHISYQQVLSQPQKYLPFIVSFVPEKTVSANPAIGFAKGYLNNVSPNMVRDLFAEASYQALTDLRKAEGGQGVFIRMTDNAANTTITPDMEKLIKGDVAKPSRPARAEKATDKEKAAEQGGESVGVPGTGGRPMTAHEEQVYNTYVKEDEKALYSTLVGISADEKRRAKPVIVAYDTGMDEAAMAAAQTGEAVVREYIGNTVAVVRSTGTTLYERLRQEAADMARKLGCDVSDISIVTIAGDDTLAQIEAELKAEARKEGRAAANLQDVIGKIINVEKSNKSKYVPVIALYDVALRWAYGLDPQQIAERLNRIALNPLGTPFTKDDLMKGVIRILPRIAPANMTEAVEAYKAAQQALQSL